MVICQGISTFLIAEIPYLAVNAGLKTLRAAGIIGKPYLINAEELLAWCLMRNRPNNSSSRSEFVAERLQAEDESSNIS